MSNRDCPECYGKLQREGDGWRCDGLVDPPRDDMELEPCTYWVEKLPRVAEGKGASRE